MNTEQSLHFHRPRSAVRQKSFLRGLIHLKDARSTFDCLVRDISPRGAKLDFSGTVSTPDVFDLYIPQKEQTLCANVTWRRGQEVGVAFAYPLAVDRPADTDDLGRRLTRIEIEIDTFKRACRKLRSSMRPRKI